jgi:hypothetical protein
MGNRTHEWVRDTAPVFLQRFLDTGSEVDFHALMGVLAGSLADRSTIGHERDYRTYEDTPGLDALRRFVRDVRHGWRDGRTLAPGEYDIDLLRDNDVLRDSA